MTATLRVRDWDSLYENHRSRELKKLEYVPVKNKMDGDGYAFLLEHKNGAAHLGAWLVILQIASRCKERGLLVGSDGCPYDTAAISRMSRIPKKIFEEAIPRLIDGCKWLESVAGAESRDKAPDGRGESAADARDERGISAESREIGAGSSRHARACDSLPFSSSSSSGSFSEETSEEISEVAKLAAAVQREEHAAKVRAAVSELEAVYVQAGAPIPEKQKQLISQFMIDLPPEKIARVVAYPKWALWSGKWPNPAKTKALINVLRDGDWDVELVERTLPMPQVRAPSAHEEGFQLAAKRFMEREI